MKWHTEADTERMLKELREFAAACYAAGKPEEVGYLLMELTDDKRKYDRELDKMAREITREAERTSKASKKPRRKP